MPLLLARTLALVTLVDPSPSLALVSWLVRLVGARDVLKLGMRVCTPGLETMSLGLMPTRLRGRRGIEVVRLGEIGVMQSD